MSYSYLSISLLQNRHVNEYISFKERVKIRKERFVMQNLFTLFININFKIVHNQQDDLRNRLCFKISYFITSLQISTTDALPLVFCVFCEFFFLTVYTCLFSDGCGVQHLFNIQSGRYQP